MLFGNLLDGILTMSEKKRKFANSLEIQLLIGWSEGKKLQYGTSVLNNSCLFYQLY